MSNHYQNHLHQLCTEPTFTRDNVVNLTCW